MPNTTVAEEDVVYIIARKSEQRSAVSTSEEPRTIHRAVLGCGEAAIRNFRNTIFKESTTAALRTPTNITLPVFRMETDRGPTYIMGTCG